jgi:hypothetical protein
MVIRNVAVYTGTVLMMVEEDNKYNQKYGIDKKCGCIQPFHLLTLEGLDSENHHSKVVG